MQRLFFIDGGLLALVNFNYITVFLQGGAVASNKHIGSAFMLLLMILFIRKTHKNKITVFMGILIAVWVVSVIVILKHIRG